MQIPETLKYAENHEWVRLDADGTIAVGITDYAQDALGDIVYVDLPEVGRIVEAGEGFAEVESTKSVNDVYAPVPGEIAAINETLFETPELVNQDPYGEAWFIKIAPAEGASLDSLMDAAAYRGYTDG
ncbi:MAG: glycine cleavage system protein GcvH [Actinomycetota bacterium]|nr:glycine cleavage system protein GcvH [Actinomycetota bacterium]